MAEEKLQPESKNPDKNLLSVIEILAQAAQEATAQMQVIADANKSLIEAITPQINLWKGWVEANDKIFKNTWGHLYDFQKDYEITTKTAIKLFRRYKWLVSPSLPMPVIYEVVKLDGKSGRQDKHINNMFIRFFSAKDWSELEVMVGGWKKNPLLKKRYKIICDCVAAIKKTDGKYTNVANAVLPSLIAQIDGAVSDYLRSKGIVWDVDYGEDVISRTGNVAKKGRKTQFTNVKSPVLSSQFDDLSNEIFLNILLQSSHRGVPLKTPFNFNRHKIMHGESVEYGRKDYLIRAFLLLDFLAGLS
jgi:hypothetical protein